MKAEESNRYNTLTEEEMNSVLEKVMKESRKEQYILHTFYTILNDYYTEQIRKAVNNRL